MAKKTKKSQAAASEARKAIWSIPGLEKRARELVQEGVLVTKGLDSLVQSLSTEFAEKLEAAKLRVTKRALNAHMDKLVWTKSVLDDLRQAIRADVGIEEFMSFKLWIPEREARAKHKFLTGLSSSHARVEFVAGMGRLSTTDLPPGAEKYQFPGSSMAKPFHIASRTNDWYIPILNGANLGVKHSRIIKDNPVRRGLSDSETRGAAAVILTNTLDLDTKKTGGPIKVYRAQASGLNVNPDLLPPSYQEKVRLILAARKQGKSPYELIYESIASRFMNLMTGWHKITHRKDGVSPEFTGPILVVFGFKEEALINAAAYYECRYKCILDQKKIAAKVRLATKQLGKAYVDLDDAMEGGTEKEIKKAQLKVAGCEAKLEALAEEKSHTIISNITDEDYEYHRLRMRAFVVRQFEEMIGPNCTVIGQGSSYVEINGAVIELNIPGNDVVTDGNLAKYCDSYGEKVLRNALARTVVVCHPYALSHRSIGREDAEDGKRLSAEVHVAPVCQDGDYLRSKLKHTVKTVAKMAQVVRHPQFVPGMLVVSSTSGVVSADSIPIPKLDETPKQKNGTPFVYPYPETKYIYTCLHTDNHFGSRARERILDRKNKRELGVAEAAFEMMRREGLLQGTDCPVHIVSNNDDPTQGNHFGTHLQPDPKQMSNTQLERYFAEQEEVMARYVKAGDTTGALELVGNLCRFGLDQFFLRGLDWVQPQLLEVFERHLEPNIDFYDSMLRRGQAAGLVFKGYSAFRNERGPRMFDTRDVGAINLGTGNHLAKSLERMLTEGVFNAQYLKILLKRQAHWQENEAYVDRHVLAPTYSNEFFAWGTVQAPGGYQWGLRFLASPSRLSSWSDTLLAQVRQDMKAGGEAMFFMKGRKTLTTFGDKHFAATANTPWSRYVMGPAHTKTDLYGTRGFPPNNTGITFIGIPVDGPDAGPELLRTLRYDVLRDWFDKPRPFDWSKFLPNAL